LTIGINEGRASALNFDVSFYRFTYEGLRNTFGDNYKAYIEHYANYGLGEARRSSPVFDLSLYKDSHQDLQDTFGGDLMKYIGHWINNGINENRKSSLAFNLDAYKNNNNDLIQNFGENNVEYIKHYLAYGINEGRAASNIFNKPNRYKSLNTEYAEHGYDTNSKYLGHWYEYCKHNLCCTADSQCNDSEFCLNGDCMSRFNYNLHAKGDCDAAVVPGISDQSGTLSINDCATRCNQSPECLGFTYNFEQRWCLPKTIYNCTDRLMNGFDFYSKQLSEHNSVYTNNYTLKARGDCAAANFPETSSTVSIEDCANRCNDTEGCLGFTYNFQNKWCLPKSQLQESYNAMLKNINNCSEILSNGFDFHSKLQFSDTLGNNESLQPNKCLISKNRYYKALFQLDGNFVIYEKTADGLNVLWSSNSAREAGDQRALVMQGDGNLVIYNLCIDGSCSDPFWATGTSRANYDIEQPYKLVMQGDGNLVIYETNGTAIWATWTNKDVNRTDFYKFDGCEQN